MKLTRKPSYFRQREWCCRKVLRRELSSSGIRNHLQEVESNEQRADSIEVFGVTEGLLDLPPFSLAEVSDTHPFL